MLEVEGSKKASLPVDKIVKQAPEVASTKPESDNSSPDVEAPKVNFVHTITSF